VLTLSPCRNLADIVIVPSVNEGERAVCSMLSTYSLLITESVSSGR